VSEDKKDGFWDVAQIPFNEEADENGFEFINAIDIAERFLEAASWASFLAQKSERLASTLAALETEKIQTERQLARLRREIFSKHYDKITKSASSEVQDAFLLAKAREEEREDDLLELEERIEELLCEIEAVTPTMNKIRGRMKVLERNMEYAKQYLDYEKLEKRISASGNRI
jgi:hypothetical protein